MTRYTNAGFKRSYTEAGFDNSQEEVAKPAGSTSQTVQDIPKVQDAEPFSGPVKKKRKRSKSGKPRLAAEGHTDGGLVVGPGQGIESAEGDHTVVATSVVGKAAKKNKKSKEKSIDRRKLASERRRLQRERERNVNTICFACREQGHAAKDCPKVISSETGSDGRKTGKQAVGICYRCGSKRHTLLRCKKPVDPENPLPFSSCFVCSGMGHLASACPQNQSKGIYPNGGCCKICGETNHLAKDCTFRKNDVSSKAAFLGTGRDAGADEDDFHTFKRKSAEVGREEKADERRKRKADVRVGAHSGVIKSFGLAMQQTKKVVTFS